MASRSARRRVEGDRELERLARSVDARPGGRALLERLAECDEDVPLSAVRLPEPAGALDFFDPAQFPDRASLRAFVAGEVFTSFMMLARAALVGRDAYGELAERIGEDALEEARESLFYIVGDLRTLAGAAVSPEPEPPVFEARHQAFSGTSRLARVASLTELAAYEAYEGADPQHWMPVFDALRGAAADTRRQ